MNKEFEFFDLTQPFGGKTLDQECLKVIYNQLQELISAERATVELTGDTAVTPMVSKESVCGMITEAKLLDNSIMVNFSPFEKSPMGEIVVNLLNENCELKLCGAILVSSDDGGTVYPKTIKYAKAYFIPPNKK